MEAILEICCGLDVHRDNIVACITKGALNCKPISEIRKFSALQHGLKSLKELLEKEVRELRDLTRYRKSIVHEVSNQKNRIEKYLEKFKEAEETLDGIPGISKVAASAIIGEIGIDMSKFPDAEHICSWAGLSPGCNESAGKTKSTKTRHGNPYIKSILCEVAWTVTRKKDSTYNNHMFINNVFFIVYFRHY